MTTNKYLVQELIDSAGSKARILRVQWRGGNLPPSAYLISNVVEKGADKVYHRKRVQPMLIKIIKLYKMVCLIFFEYCYNHAWQLLAKHTLLTDTTRALSTEVVQLKGSTWMEAAKATDSIVEFSNRKVRRCGMRGSLMMSLGLG